jgi:hypothetical protein
VIEDNITGETGEQQGGATTSTEEPLTPETEGGGEEDTHPKRAYVCRSLPVS